MSDKTEMPVMSRIGVIFLTWRRCLQRRALFHGISLKQLYILRQLQKREVLSPSEIAELLFCDRPTATSFLHTMKKYGWITSEKDPLNLKKQRILLTHAGRGKLASLSGFTPEPSFDPLACFTPEELMKFEALLKKLAVHMKDLPKE